MLCLEAAHLVLEEVRQLGTGWKPTAGHQLLATASYLAPGGKPHLVSLGRSILRLQLGM